MQHDIDAEFQWTLVVRRGEGRIDEGFDAMASANIGKAL
jgi:hypothetical protein